MKVIYNCFSCLFEKFHWVASMPRTGYNPLTANFCLVVIRKSEPLSKQYQSPKYTFSLDFVLSIMIGVVSAPQCCLLITFQLQSTARGDLFQLRSPCQVRHIYRTVCHTVRLVVSGSLGAHRQFSIGAKYAEYRLRRAAIMNPFIHKTHRSSNVAFFQILNSGPYTEVSNHTPGVFSKTSNALYACA